eukprot:CAMPEP_0203768730 /NCGR_PEP_ID=MMETSP0099_2-20121227/1763_1 /ASSEMBLY_ACC=CAM_ASM_000209 /TAXON_ID=96639 /ORGANISM=" , Strain NY0313808BC1" /LENGTH=57 /DNA_ID=CAMNT_0050665479 /DNA_START=348 /DNA_END=518 /DNA_ORIENTATION=+
MYQDNFWKEYERYDGQTTENNDCRCCCKLYGWGFCKYEYDWWDDPKALDATEGAETN